MQLSAIHARKLCKAYTFYEKRRTNSKIIPNYEILMENNSVILRYNHSFCTDCTADTDYINRDLLLYASGE